MCHFARDLGMFRYATYLNFFTPGADDVAMSITLIRTELAVPI